MSDFKYLNLDAFLTQDLLFQAGLRSILGNPPYCGSASVVQRLDKVHREVDRIIKSNSVDESFEFNKIPEKSERPEFIVVTRLDWPSLQVIQKLHPNFLAYQPQGSLSHVQYAGPAPAKPDTN